MIGIIYKYDENISQVDTLKRLIKFWCLFYMAILQCINNEMLLLRLRK